MPRQPRPRYNEGGGAAWVHDSPCWPCCMETHDHVVMLGRELSKQLVREYNTTKYTVHGLFGIFAAGDPIEYNVTGKLRKPFQRPWNENYEGAKTEFIYTRLCALSQARHISTVCEIGFNAGLSAMLLLESARSAVVRSFDLGDFTWARRANELVRQAYGSRFPGVVFGDSTKALRRQRADDANFVCDAAFIDGAKTYKGRYQHILDLREVSRPGVPVFLDEITSEACVNGSVPEAEHRTECLPLSSGYYESTRAYSDACRNGSLRIIECAWPSKLIDKDGVCLGELL